MSEDRKRNPLVDVRSIEDMKGSCPKANETVFRAQDVGANDVAIVFDDENYRGDVRYVFPFFLVRSFVVPLLFFCCCCCRPVAASILKIDTTTTVGLWLPPF